MSAGLRGEMFWVDRWRSSAAFGLPLEARGLYRELLSLAWISGGKLPTTDTKALRRLVAAEPDEWDRAWPLIAHYWVDGVNAIQAGLYTDAATKHNTKSTAGRHGAAKRWQPDATPSAIALPSDCHQSANTDSIHSVSEQAATVCVVASVPDKEPQLFSTLLTETADLCVVGSSETVANKQSSGDSGELTLRATVILDAWHAACPALAQPRSTSALRKVITAALKRDPSEVWATRFRRVAASAFLRGDRTSWRATLQWVLKQSNAEKIDAGSYDDRTPGVGRGSSAGLALLERYGGAESMMPRARRVDHG